MTAGLDNLQLPDLPVGAVLAALQRLRDAAQQAHGRLQEVTELARLDIALRARRVLLDRVAEVRECLAIDEQLDLAKAGSVNQLLAAFTDLAVALPGRPSPHARARHYQRFRL